MKQILLSRICTVFLFFILLIMPLELFAQTQGLIFRQASGAGSAIMNPGGTGNVFINGNPSASFTIPFTGLPAFTNEPIDDISRGGSFIDLVASSLTEPASILPSTFIYFDEDNEVIIFRKRLVRASSAAKAYSFLFASDKLGPLNPFFRATNPGFAFEVAYISGTGVKVFDASGNQVGPTFPELQYHQRAVSDPYLGGGGKLGAFYDFYVPISAINAIPGIDLSTQGYRIAGLTLTVPQGFLEGGNIADISGIDNTNSSLNDFNLAQIINQQQNVLLSDIAISGFPAFVQISNTPVIDKPVLNGATTLSGFVSEAAGTTISVSINGGEAITTTSNLNFSWQVTVPTLTIGDVITVTASAAGKTTSDMASVTVIEPNNPVLACLPPVMGSIHPQKGSGSDGEGRIAQLSGVIDGLDAYINVITNNGANPENINQLGMLVYIAGTNTLGEFRDINLSPFPTTPFYFKTGSTLAERGDLVQTPGTDAFALRLNSSAQSGNNSGMVATRAHEVVLFARQNPDLTSPPAACESNRSNIVNLNLTLLATPAFANTPYNADNTSIGGTASEGNEIIINRNGLFWQTTPIVEGSWLLDPVALVDGDVIEIFARNTSTGVTSAKISTTVTAGTDSGNVIAQSVKPIVTGAYLSSSASISGFSTEGAGTVIRVFDQNNTLIGTSIVDLTGTWTLNISPSLGGLTPAVTSFVVTAEGPGKTESDPTEPISVFSGKLDPPTVMGPIRVGDTSISVSDVENGDLVKLFIDGIPVGLATSSGGSVSFTAGFSLLGGSDGQIAPEDIYREGQVTATRSSGIFAESDPSNEVTIIGVESFKIEYSNSSGEATDPSTITPQTALNDFNIRITARDGVDGSGDIFTTFNGEVVFSPNFLTTAQESQNLIIGQFTGGVFAPYSVSPLEGLEGGQITVFSQDDTQVTGQSNTFVVNNPSPGTAAGELNIISTDPFLSTANIEGITVTLAGDGFVPGSVIRFEDKQLPHGPSIYVDLETTYISSTEISAIITPELLDQDPGSYEIQVFNPLPGGGLSNSIPFEISLFEVIFVTPTGTGVGSSFENGASLSSALDNANPGTEIWVQEGTYTGSFTIKDGTSLYGGFVGGETERGQRDLSRPTILDGNGACFVVQFLSNAANDTIIDGFIIKNGNASTSADPACANGGNGGGIYNQGSPRIVNIFFENNNAGSQGGGFYSTGSGAAPVLINTLFSGNTSTNNGSAIASSNGSLVTVVNPTIAGNNGGNSVVYADANNLITIINGIVWDNTPSTITLNQTIQTSIIEGGYTGGTSVSNVDPVFINAATKNYSLSLNSPALNSGTPSPYQPSGIAEGVLTDVSGNVRFFGQIDLGSLESGTKGTFSGPPAIELQLKNAEKIDQWHLIGSPSAEMSYRQLLSPFWLQGMPGGNIAIGNKNLWYWDSAAEQYKTPTDLVQENPQAGRGYFFYLFDDQDYDGIPNGFPKTITASAPENPSTITIQLFSHQESTVIASTERFPRWNLISNPWGVPINVDSLFVQIDSQLGTGPGSGSVNRNVYLWSPNDNSLNQLYPEFVSDQGGNLLTNIGKYTSYSATSNNVIAPFQAFWIYFDEQFSGGGSKNFIMDKNQLTNPIQTVDFNADLLNTEAFKNEFSMAVFNQDGTGSEFQLIFDERVLEGISHSFNALALTPPKDSYTLLYSTDNRNSYVRNHLPADIQSYTELVLDVTSVNSGEITLVWKDIPSALYGLGLSILDTWTGEVIRLERAGTYVFEHTSNAKLNSASIDDSKANSLSTEGQAVLAAESSRTITNTSFGNTVTQQHDNSPSIAQSSIPRLGMPGIFKENQASEQTLEGVSGRFILRIDPEGFTPIPELPTEITLSQNYPNPFNPITNITFTLPETGDITLEVFNVLGQRLATLVNGTIQAGTHTVSFDARNFASGVYVYRLKSGNRVITKKMTLLK